jgi:arylsulfatase A-like enzyme/Flp pilus assembly protein TadD
LFSLAAFPSFSEAQKAIPKHQNVLVITIDTLRADYLSCYGSTKVKTPNIDALAHSGVLFKNTVAPAPFTLPSHVSLFTGLIPPVHGAQDNSGFFVNDKLQTLAESFAAAQYKTAAFVGAFAVDSRFNLDQGFDFYEDDYTSTSLITTPERKADKVIDAAFKWLDKNKTNRWFVWIHLFDPHFSYDPPEKFRKLYPNDLYGGEVAYVDDQIGRLKRFLKQNGLSEKTLIVLTADHGESLGEHNEKTHGIFAYESTLRIPLIISPAPTGASPKVVNQRVRLIDVAPTISELQGVSFPNSIQGISLIPLIKAESKGIDNSYFEAVSMYLKAGWAPLRGFYSDHFKFIDLPVPELYELNADPKESKNLCADKQLCKTWRDKFQNYSKVFLKNPVTQNPIDPETAEKLRSLGYVTGTSRANPNKTYTVKDDPKELIELHDGVYDAVNFYRAGNPSEALNRLQAIIKKRTDYPLAYIHSAYILHAEGRLDEAISLLKVAIDNKAADSAILGKLGTYLHEAGKQSDAIVMLNSALKLDPQNVDHFNYLGMAYSASGKPQDALKAFNDAVAIDPSNISVLNNLGALYLRMGQFQKASQQYETVLSVSPGNAGAYSGLGFVHAYQKNWPEAIRLWNLAIKNDDRQFDAMLNLAFAYMETQQKSKAVPLLTKFEQTAPRNRYAKVLPKVRELIQQLNSNEQ